MNQPTVPPGGIRSWLITGMLFVFLIINFADKAVLGLTAVPLMNELGISPAAYGLLSSGFFFLFSVAALLVGLVSNRLSTKWVIFGMAVLWSVSQMTILAAASGFVTLLVTRIVLGAAEGPATPIANHAAHKWFADRDRSLVSGLIGLGVPVGVIIASPILSWVIADHGWRAAFGVTGAVGLVWAVGWLFIGKEGPIKDSMVTPGGRSDPQKTVSTWRILRTGTWLASVAGSFAAFWSVAVLVAWLPPYLAKVLGYPTRETGYVVVVPWAVMGAAIFLHGVVARRVMRRGVSSRRARGVVPGVCVVVAGVTLLAAIAVGDGWLKILLLGVGFGLGSVIIPVGQTTSAEICPVERRGGVLGAYAAVYSVAGIIAPALTGSLVGAYVLPATGYAVAFAVTGALLVVCGVLAACFVRPERDRERIAMATREPDGDLIRPAVMP
ncbi:MFS transporter [Amycolatopsis jejuensis]|uniref:MFS transporter n=1 Tax=Amycolatopsis jejuensis TaxID=330084 RepID=UPI0007C4D4D4|nr:MFS transporter [Amycolatopsis jejuensis]